MTGLQAQRDLVLVPPSLLRLHLPPASLWTHTRPFLSLNASPHPEKWSLLGEAFADTGPPLPRSHRTCSSPAGSPPDPVTPHPWVRRAHEHLSAPRMSSARAGPASFCPRLHRQCPARNSLTVYYGTGKRGARVATWVPQNLGLLDSTALSSQLPQQPPLPFLSPGDFFSGSATDSSFLTHLINGEVSWDSVLTCSAQGSKRHLCPPAP